jgi:hypothetical protein
MTAPGLLEQLQQRDSSTLLAMAALLRNTAASGATDFAGLAVNYREEYLAASRIGHETAVDAGTLSMDEVRRHLAASVLPRLVEDGLIEPLAGDS